MFEFHWPTKTIFASGLTKRICEYMIPSIEAKILIVAPHEKWAKPLTQDIRSQLLEGGWDHIEIFAEVEPNPSWKTVTSGVKRAQEMGANAVLAIGGGSSMDAGKVIAERSEANFLCTIPTTAGTGGEISPWAVITNLETREKDSVVAKWPNLALLDPDLTLTVPPKTTLFTGIDAFIHGLEAYVSSVTNPITDALALAGMERIAPHLRMAVEDGEQLEARSAMLEGSLLTGVAMLHAGLGLMHAIGNVAGGLYHHLPHGLILMQCMDAVLEYNRPKIEGRLSHIKPILDQVHTEMDALFAQLSITDVEIRQADVVTLAKRALVNVNARTNPRPATQEDIESIVRQSFVIR